MLIYDFSALAAEFEGSERISTDAAIHAHTFTLGARHHLGEGWAMDALLPVNSVEEDGPDGSPLRRSNGFGDMELGGRYEFAALWGAGGYAPSLTLRLALGLPTGDSTSAESSLGTGAGALSAVAQLTYTQFLTQWFALLAPVSTRQPLSRTELGTLLGTQLTVGAGALVVPTPGLQVVAGLNHAIRDHGDNEITGELTNSGGQWLSAFLTLSGQIGERLSLWAGGSLPLRTEVNGRQLTQTVSVTGGLALTFGKPEREQDDHGGHDHGDGHDHGNDDPAQPVGLEPVPSVAVAMAPSVDPSPLARQDEHTPPAAPTPAPRPAHRADVEDAATGGDSFALASALSPGKLTVIDFWATWCEPCEQIDRDLRDLAQRNPKVAVRRVEITDADCPASREHLGGRPVLPAVWIYGADGKRMVDLQGVSPERVLEAVSRLLQ